MGESPIVILSVLTPRIWKTTTCRAKKYKKCFYYKLKHFVMKILLGYESVIWNCNTKSNLICNFFHFEMWYALKRWTFDIFCFDQIWWTFFKSTRQYHSTTDEECMHASMVLPVENDNRGVWNDTFYIIQAYMMG